MSRRSTLSTTAALVFLTALLLVLVPTGAWSAPAGGTVDVIVVLHDAHAPGNHEANRAEAAAIARQHGLAPIHTYGTALFGFTAAVPEGRLAALGNDPRVDFVDRDRPVQAYGETSPWGVSRIGAPLSDNTGAGIHVYVLDTGIDSDHPDLEANVGNGYAVETCKGPGSRCRFSWDDDHGHGSHVAGTVAARDNDIDVIGVAPEATLHAVKVLNSNGSGSWSGVVAGVDWTANETKSLGAPTVANMSLGGSGSKTGTCSDSGFTGTDSLHAAICNAKNVGVVFAVAAGNSYADAANHVPAAYDDAVLTVSATKSSDDWPAWSNWGDDAAGWTAHDSAPVAIAAPGVSVLSTAMGGGTTTKSGTSMAAPHVAGAVALHLAVSTQGADPTAFANVRAGLLGADESTGTWSNTSGYSHDEGLLDVRSLGTTTDPDVTAPTISGVGAPNVTSSSADITWTTDEAADSTVDYGTTSGAYSGATSDEALVTGHKISLTGLSSNTTYYYRVRSKDAAGNEATSGEYTFSTLETSTSSGVYVTTPAGTNGYSTSGGRTNSQHLHIIVTLNSESDGTGSAISGASTSVAICRAAWSGGPCEATYTGTGTTGSDGTITFKVTNAPAGYYRTTVTGVTAADGSTHTPATPDNEYLKTS